VLLFSETYSEPRAKGATLRALRGLLGEGFPVEDETTVAGRGKAKVATSLVGDVAALKNRALKRGRSVVKAGEAAIEEVAKTVAELVTSAPSTATTRSGQTRKAGQAAKSAKSAKKTATASPKPGRRSATKATK
jgi:hypothetical protein